MRSSTVAPFVAELCLLGCHLHVLLLLPIPGRPFRVRQANLVALSLLRSLQSCGTAVRAAVS